MKLHEGCEEEYKKRHDALWPELARELTAAGIRDYVIYLDRTTHTLYASLKAAEHNTLDDLPSRDIVRKWRAFMTDLMETNPDGSPVVRDLTEMFYLD